MNQVLLVVGKKRLSPGQLYVYLIRRRRGVRGEEKKKKISRLCDDGSCVFFSLRDSLFVFNLVGSVLFSRLWDADGMP